MVRKKLGVCQSSGQGCQEIGPSAEILRILFFFLFSFSTYVSTYIRENRSLLISSELYSSFRGQDGHDMIMLGKATLHTLSSLLSAAPQTTFTIYPARMTSTSTATCTCHAQASVRLYLRLFILFIPILSPLQDTHKHRLMLFLFTTTSSFFKQRLF